MPNTTNYSFPTPADTDLVKNGADAIRDLGDAVDTAMNTALGTKKSGLILLNTTSFSAVASVSLPAATFTATYNNYLIRMNNLSSSTTAASSVRLRASGVDDSAANYRRQTHVLNNTTLSGEREISLTSWPFTFYAETSVPAFMQFEIQNPFLTEATSALATIAYEVGGTIKATQQYLGLNTATSYDSLTVIGGGNLTGSISVYGFSI